MPSKSQRRDIHRPAPIHHVLMLGAPGAGVRTFSTRARYGAGPLPYVFDPDTIHVDATVAATHHLPFFGGSNTARLRLWDMPGRCSGVPLRDLENAAVVIALYDVTSDTSLQGAVRQLSQAFQALRSVKIDIPLFLVANKCDLLPPGTDAVPGIDNGIMEAAQLGVEFARSSSGPTPHVEQLLSRVVAAYSRHAYPDAAIVVRTEGGVRLPFRPPPSPATRR